MSRGFRVDRRKKRKENDVTLKIYRNLALLAMMFVFMALPKPAKAQTCNCDYCGTEEQACIQSCNGDQDCINACQQQGYECFYYCYLPCVY